MQEQPALPADARCSVVCLISISTLSALMVAAEGERVGVFVVARRLLLDEVAERQAFRVGERGQQQKGERE